MAYTPYAALLVWVILFWFSTARAADISFQPRLEAGVMQYSFESEAVSSITPTEPVPFNTGFNFSQQGFEYSDNLPVVGLGGTFFFNRLFLDVSGQWATDGEDSAMVAFSGYDAAGNSFLAAEPLHKVRFNRSDTAVSIGYAFSTHFSVFAGYKWAKTEFKSTFQGRISMVNYDVDSGLDGTVGGRIWGDLKFNFEYEGPFVGAIHGWEFNNGRFLKGVLTASLALAQLEGEVAIKQKNTSVTVTWVDGQSVPDVTNAVEDGGLTNRFDTDGSTLGLTVGIGWRGSTALEGLSYYLGLSGYRYEFEPELKSESDINETATVLKGGLSYAF
jgi:hypothetical protein